MGEDAVVAVVPGRSCAGCTMCCKLLSIGELNKPQQQWCTHCDIGVGCKIHANKPTECSAFFCQYLLRADLEEDWKPSKCRMVLSYESGPKRIVIHVDEGRKDAWKREPYYSQIKRWAQMAVVNQGQVIVWQGLDAIAVLPHRDINLGRVRQDQLIMTSEKHTHAGVEMNVLVVDRDDPRLAGMQQPTEESPSVEIKVQRRRKE